MKNHVTSACCVQLCYCTLLLLLLVQDVNNLEKKYIWTNLNTLYINIFPELTNCISANPIHLSLLNKVRKRGRVLNFEVQSHKT